MTSTKANRRTGELGCVGRSRRGRRLPRCETVTHLRNRYRVRQDDPTIGVRVSMPKSDGFRSWSEDDIAAFEAVYPVGSKAQFALALLLNPALRCSLTWSAWVGAMSGVAPNPGQSRGQRFRSKMYRCEVRNCAKNTTRR